MRERSAPTNLAVDIPARSTGVAHAPVIVGICCIPGHGLVVLHLRGREEQAEGTGERKEL